MVQNFPQSYPQALQNFTNHNLALKHTVCRQKKPVHLYRHKGERVLRRTLIIPRTAKERIRVEPAQDDAFTLPTFYPIDNNKNFKLYIA